MKTSKKNTRESPKSSTAINVVVFDATQKPRIAEIGDDQLTKLQRIIGGFVETAPFNEYTLIFDEEGGLKNLPQNPHFPQLVGPVIVAKTRNGECVSFTDSECKDVQKRFRSGTVSYMV